jgi:hypothetical protein
VVKPTYIGYGAVQRWLGHGAFCPKKAVHGGTFLPSGEVWVLGRALSFVVVISGSGV